MARNRAAELLPLFADANDRRVVFAHTTISENDSKIDSNYSSKIIVVVERKAFIFINMQVSDSYQNGTGALHTSAPAFLSQFDTAWSQWGTKQKRWRDFA